MRTVKRAATWLAVPLAAALVVLALDVLSVPREIAADDVRFAGAPNRSRALWDDVDFLPFRPAARVLDVDDDLEYRETAWTFVRVDPSKVVIAGENQPELEALRGKAELEITTRSKTEPEPLRRARLLNALGALNGARFSPDPIAQEIYLRTAVEAFRNAVRLDPGNAEAKVNLELVLRVARAAELPGEAPYSGPARGRLSGRGRSGTGY